jgi:hypothetical protein
MIESGYRGPAVADLVGISYRQLDYWDRTGLVRPSYPAQGSGTSRLYTRDDVVRLAIVKGLLTHGVSLPMIRELSGGVLTEAEGEWVDLGDEYVAIRINVGRFRTMVDRFLHLVPAEMTAS